MFVFLKKSHILWSKSAGQQLICSFTLLSDEIERSGPEIRTEKKNPRPRLKIFHLNEKHLSVYSMIMGRASIAKAIKT